MSEACDRESVVVIIKMVGAHIKDGAEEECEGGLAEGEECNPGWPRGVYPMGMWVGVGGGASCWQGQGMPFGQVWAASSGAMGLGRNRWGMGVARVCATVAAKTVTA